MTTEIRQGIAALCLAGVFLIAVAMVGSEDGEALLVMAAIAGVAGLWLIGRGATSNS